MQHSRVEYAGGTLTMSLPALAHLYSVNLRSWPQPASVIDFASTWFLTMFLTFRSSKAIRSCFRTSSALTLWLKSARWLATLACWTATSSLAWTLFSEPLRVLEKLLWRRFSLPSAFLRNCGCGIFTPSVVVRSDFNPKSIPTGDVGFDDDCAISSSSYTREACHSPFGSLTTVQVFTFPCGVRL